MTTEEMRELDTWIAEHVMGWKTWKDGMMWDLVPVWETGNPDNPTFKWFYPTTDPAAAMMVLKRCAEKDLPTVYKSRATDEWCVDNQSTGQKPTIIATAPTLESAICLFAKSLFSQTERKEG